MNLRKIDATSRMLLLFPVFFSRVCFSAWNSGDRFALPFGALVPRVFPSLVSRMRDRRRYYASCARTPLFLISPFCMYFFLSDEGALCCPFALEFMIPASF